MSDELTIALSAHPWATLALGFGLGVLWASVVEIVHRAAKPEQGDGR